jgi:predicted acylesterase/phospholipase RssA
MPARFSRPAIGLLLLLAVGLGCAGDRGRRQPSVEQLRSAVGWLDPEAQAEIRSAVQPDELIQLAAQARANRKPAVLPPRRSVLVVSGGGAFGAYSAGVLCGWTQTGTRPEFDVVTGVSTGALIACYAFLGPSFDGELQRNYTTRSNDDIYRMRRFPAGLLADSLADNTPLALLIEQEVTDERIRLVAAEHARGRRLYVGTSNLETRRAVYWDMGAIATRGDVGLFRAVLLASAAIPGFFPPTRIPVTVDGVRYVERHIDGGTSSSMFFVPPWVPPEQRAELGPGWLYGSDLYILVAGKLYADPAPVRSRTLAIAQSAVSTIIYDQTRSDLHKLFLMTMLTGMNYHLSSIPLEMQAPTSATEFDPAEMCRMFQAGAEWAMTNPRWRDTPPGYEPGEGVRYRGGTVLTDRGRYAPLGYEGVPIPGIPKK